MKILVFNSKGGCGKSTVAREVLAAPEAKKYVLVEIDELNQTQSAYKKYFKDVEMLRREEIPNLLTLLNEHDNVVVDVGADNITATLDTMIDYALFDDIDRVIIPMKAGRTDCENAIKTFKFIKDYCDDIKFVFVEHNISESLERQYSVFFNNLDSININKLNDSDYATISASEAFIDAQSSRELVINIANGGDYKAQALEAKQAGDKDKFQKLMSKELRKRAASILVEKTIMPANRVLLA